jgi:hypothetical protein
VTQMNDATTINVHLRYLVENCQIALKKLQELNIEPIRAMQQNNPINPNPIGDLHRIVQDYLIVRVAGLFDKQTNTSSFENTYGTNEQYKQLKNEEIVRYMIKMRNTFVAHVPQNLPNSFPDTQKIISSNLSSVFQNLINILPR